MEENMMVMSDPKIFYFHFNWRKDLDESLEHETEFIIKSRESLADNKIEKLHNYC